MKMIPKHRFLPGVSSHKPSNCIVAWAQYRIYLQYQLGNRILGRLEACTRLLVSTAFKIAPAASSKTRWAKITCAGAAPRNGLDAARNCNRHLDPLFFFRMHSRLATIVRRVPVSPSCLEQQRARALHPPSLIPLSAL